MRPDNPPGPDGDAAPLSVPSADSLTGSHLTLPASRRSASGRVVVTLASVAKAPGAMKTPAEPAPAGEFTSLPTTARSSTLLPAKETASDLQKRLTMPESVRAGGSGKLPEVKLPPKTGILPNLRNQAFPTNADPAEKTAEKSRGGPPPLPAAEKKKRLLPSFRFKNFLKRSKPADLISPAPGKEPVKTDSPQSLEDYNRAKTPAQAPGAKEIKEAFAPLPSLKQEAAAAVPKPEEKKETPSSAPLPTAEKKEPAFAPLPTVEKKEPAFTPLPVAEKKEPAFTPLPTVEKEQPAPIASVREEKPAPASLPVVEKKEHAPPPLPPPVLNAPPVEASRNAPPRAIVPPLMDSAAPAPTEKHRLPRPLNDARKGGSASPAVSSPEPAPAAKVGAPLSDVPLVTAHPPPLPASAPEKTSSSPEESELRRPSLDAPKPSVVGPAMVAAAAVLEHEAAVVPVAAFKGIESTAPPAIQTPPEGFPALPKSPEVSVPKDPTSITALRAGPPAEKTPAPSADTSIKKSIPLPAVAAPARAFSSTALPSRARSAPAQPKEIPLPIPAVTLPGVAPAAVKIKLDDGKKTPEPISAPAARSARARKRQLVGTIIFYLLFLAVVLPGLYFAGMSTGSETRLEGQVIPPSGMTLNDEVWIVTDFRELAAGVADDLAAERAPKLQEIQERQDHVQRAQADIAAREERIRLLQEQVQASKDEIDSVIKQAHQDAQKVWDGPGSQLDAEYNARLDQLQDAIASRAKSLHLAYQPDNTYRSPEVWANAYRLALYQTPPGVDGTKEHQWIEDQLKQWRDYTKTVDDRQKQLRDQAAQIQLSPTPKVGDLNSQIDDLQHRIDSAQSEEDPIKMELQQAQTDLVQAQTAESTLDEKYYQELYALPEQNVTKRLPVAPNGRFSWRQMERDSAFAEGENVHYYWIFARAIRPDGRQFWALGRFSVKRRTTQPILIPPESFISTKVILRPDLPPDEQQQ